MLSEEMEKALNDQVNAEFYASYLYLSASTYFESLNLKGVARWMKMQYVEEIGHAMRIFNHIQERGGRVRLKPIKEVPTEWDTPLDAAKEALNHEIMVTGLINGLVDLAASLKDHATVNFLQWFIAEQVEEEEQTTELVESLKMIGSDSASLFMYDNELGQRPKPILYIESADAKSN